VPTTWGVTTTRFYKKTIPAGESRPGCPRLARRV